MGSATSLDFLQRKDLPDLPLSVAVSIMELINRAKSDATAMTPPSPPVTVVTTGMSHAEELRDAPVIFSERGGSRK